MASMRWLLLVLILAVAVAGLGCFKGGQPKSSGAFGQQVKHPGESPTNPAQQIAGTPKPGIEPGTPGQPGTETPGTEKPGAMGKPGAGWTGDAQDFEVTGFDNKKFKISDFAGQPVVLNFWAAWCGPCKGEFPDFQAVYNEKKGQFVMISVAVDENQDPVKFVADNKYNWIFAHDTDGSKRYGVQGIPLTVFISRTGDIVDKQTGSMDKATFESKLAKIL